MLKNPATCPTLKPAFTLVEILLFVVIVLVLITILLTTSGNVFRTRSVYLESVATTIASCEIEGLRKTAFASLPGSGSITSPDPCAQDLSKLPSGSSATRTVSNFNADADNKDIIISVNWTENGVTHNVKLDTLISKYGI
jgi:type II secretory pathway pseudopilin PulG